MPFTESAWSIKRVANVFSIIFSTYFDFDFQVMDIFLPLLLWLLPLFHFSLLWLILSFHIYFTTTATIIITIIICTTVLLWLLKCHYHDFSRLAFIYPLTFKLSMLLPCRKQFVDFHNKSKQWFLIGAAKKPHFKQDP